MRRTIPAAALFMVAFSAAILAGDNLRQWRRPELNGLSKEVGLVRTWSATTNIAWKLPTFSRTGSTPIIWGDTIFLNVATAEFSGGTRSTTASARSLFRKDRSSGRHGTCGRSGSE
jgi:hypothetical protein